MDEKSYGQIGFEALIRVVYERDKKAGLPWTQDSERVADACDWESQPQSVRANWQAVGLAIAAAVEQRPRSLDEPQHIRQAEHLAWFEAFYTVVSVVTARFMAATGTGSEIIDAVNDLITWERKHPKPE